MRRSNGDKNISNANLIVTCELNWPSNFDSVQKATKKKKKNCSKPNGG